MSTSRTREKADGELFKSTGIDDNATSTAVTIDASENVLVGRTSVGNTGNGHSIRGADSAIFSRDASGETMQVCRNAATGELIRFNSNGSQIGSIGTSGGATYFGSAQSGIMFNGVNQNPTNGTSTRVDNTNDLGASSYRYKDIYLGGGAFLGGTATANKLDDYEEGTWSADGSAHSLSIITQGGFYRKVGSLVHVNIYFDIPANSNATAVLIGGLPFTAAGSANYSQLVGRSNQGAVICQVNAGNSKFDMRLIGSDAGKQYNQMSGSYILISGTYVAE